MSKQRAKGTAFESAVLPWWRVLWPAASRTGSKAFDAGDYEFTGPYCIEAKNHKEMKLAAWMKQALMSAQRIGAAFPMVVHKRKMFGPQGAYVTMTVETFVRHTLHERGLTPAEIEALLAAHELVEVSEIEPTPEL